MNKAFLQFLPYLIIFRSGARQSLRNFEKKMKKIPCSTGLKKPIFRQISGTRFVTIAYFLFYFICMQSRYVNSYSILSPCWIWRLHILMNSWFWTFYYLHYYNIAKYQNNFLIYVLKKVFMIITVISLYIKKVLK